MDAFVKFHLLYVLNVFQIYCQRAKDVFYTPELYTMDTTSGPCYNLAKLKIGLDYHQEHIELECHLALF